MMAHADDDVSGADDGVLAALSTAYRLTDCGGDNGRGLTMSNGGGARGRQLLLSRLTVTTMAAVARVGSRLLARCRRRQQRRRTWTLALALSRGVTATAAMAVARVDGGSRLFDCSLVRSSTTMTKAAALVDGGSRLFDHRTR